MIAKSRNAAARKAPIRIKRRINASVIALFPQGVIRKGSLFLARVLTPSYDRRLSSPIAKLPARIVVEAWIIRWPSRHELASDIFARTAVSGFIGSSGRPSGHGNKMTKWQDNGIPCAKAPSSSFSAAVRTLTGIRSELRAVQR